MLATAARMEFPNVHFIAPAGQTTPAVVPMTRTIRKARPWRRWAVAAAVLLALTGLSASGYWMQRDYSQASQTIQEKKAVALAATQRRTAALAQIRELPRLEQEKIADVRKAEREKQLKLSVRGPATATAGAPTTYEIADRQPERSTRRRQTLGPCGMGRQQEVRRRRHSGRPGRQRQVHRHAAGRPAAQAATAAHAGRVRQSPGRRAIGAGQRKAEPVRAGLRHAPRNR